MNVDHPTLNAISLCSGVGMLDEGFHAGLRHMGIRSSTVLYAEREAYPVSVLEARMEEGSIHPAPIWFGDFTELPARQFRGVVDCVVAGFPCQDLSVAGRRAGLDGKRSGLFFEVVRIAADCGAWLMLLENVAGIATATASVVDAEEGELDERAASRVVGELADLGWNAEWIVISASDVGASHVRARWFCVAWKLGYAQHAGRNAAEIGSGAAQGNDGDAGGQIGSGELARSGGADGEMGNAESEREIREADEQRRSGTSRRAGESVGNTNEQRSYRSGSLGQQAGCGESSHDGFGMADSCGTRSAFGISRQNAREEGFTSFAINCSDGHQLADTNCARLEGIKCGRGADSSGGGQQDGSTSERCGLFAPGPSDPRWADIIRDNPELAPALEPSFCKQVNGLPFNMDDCRAARLKCSGNGVVALCASVATVVLARRAGIF